MPLSKHYIDRQNHITTVDTKGLVALLKTHYPKIVFAYLMGSSTKGIIEQRSDLDIAIYTSEDLRLDEYSQLTEQISQLHDGIRCDLGLLNRAEPVYCFEALKGKLLFYRDQERWLHFYSTTCRQYESQMFHYDKQRVYRLSS